MAFGAFVGSSLALPLVACVDARLAGGLNHNSTTHHALVYLDADETTPTPCRLSSNSP